MESETGRNAGRKEEQDMEYRIVEKKEGRETIIVRAM